MFWHESVSVHTCGRGGVPHPADGWGEWWGTPPIRRQSSIVRTCYEVVCLLRSRRRTFSFSIKIVHRNIPGVKISGRVFFHQTKSFFKTLVTLISTTWATSTSNKKVFLRERKRHTAHHIAKYSVCVWGGGGGGTYLGWKGERPLPEGGGGGGGGTYPGQWRGVGKYLPRQLEGR